MPLLLGNRVSGDFSTLTRSTSPTLAKLFPTARPSLQAAKEDISMEDQNGQLALKPTPASTPVLGLTNGAIAQGRLVIEGDDRSSSLSDIDDGPEQEEPEGDNPILGEELAEDDSEAETERLENSPQKLGKHKNVVLSSSLQRHEQSPSKLIQHSTIEQREDNVEQGPIPEIMEENAATSSIGKGVCELKPLSAATSLVDSFGGGMKVPSPPEVAGKKRKRTSPRSREMSDGIENTETARKRNGSIKSELNGNSFLIQNVLSDHDIEENQSEVDDATASDVEAEQTNDGGNAVKNDGGKPLPTKTKKEKTGKRKGKKLRDGSPGDTAQTNAMAVDDGYGAENGQVLEIDNVDEGEETAAAEGDGEEAEAEIAARTEEERKSQTLATHYYIAYPEPRRLQLASLTWIQ